MLGFCVLVTGCRRGGTRCSFAWQSTHPVGNVSFFVGIAMLWFAATRFCIMANGLYWLGAEPRLVPMRAGITSTCARPHRTFEALAALISSEMWMHPDLELIVLADEEARARLALAEQRRDSDLTSACAERDAAIDSRRREITEALERELHAIREDGDGCVAELQRRQAQYLIALAEAGERKFGDAVALYLRIVCEVSP